MIQNPSTGGKSTLAPLAGWAMIPGWVYSRGLSCTAIAVYGLLSQYGTFDNPTGTYRECRPARATMAARLGISAATVDRALAELVKAGAITRTTRHDHDGSQLPSVYTVQVGSITAPSYPQGGYHQRGGGVITSDEGGSSPVMNNPEPRTQNQTPPPTPREDQLLAAVAKLAGGEEESDEIKKKARTVLEPMVGTDRDALYPHVIGALRRGLTVKELNEAINQRTPKDVRNLTAFMRHRIDNAKPSISISGPVKFVKSCAYTEDPRTPGVCSVCGLPATHIRHRKAA